MSTNHLLSNGEQEKKGNLPTIHTLWIGNTLPTLARLTLASYMRCGHPVVLHSYQDIELIPEGVTIENARRTIPEKTFLPWLKSGRLAYFSDIFRFRLLHDGADIWSDLDVFCLKPLPKTDYLMAHEHNQGIACGTLALPPHSPLLAKLLAASSDPAFIPPWFPRRRVIKYRMIKALGINIAHKMPWATIGPNALTYYAKETGEDRYVSPIDVLYPINGSQTRLLFDPGLAIADLITPRTLSIHLYNEVLNRQNMKTIPIGSPLHQMLEIVGISASSL
ncbi:MAG: galactosyltransferase Lgt5 [Betaproteobacteria bacterium]|nr:galactosyltransferase Lgt5 [Betaproteobacteria bacterium]